MAHSMMNKVILGTAGLGGVWGEVDAEESITTILEALEQGINALDTAPAYGDAERFVGQALAQWGGVMPPVSTKVGRLRSYKADEATYDYTSDGMMSSVENSLETLNIPIIDVLFLHDPAAINPEEIEKIVMQMQLFKRNGYTKKIGIGGNVPEWFAPYLEYDIFDVIMEYNRLNACSIEALSTTIPICVESGKEYYAASPLNMGLLGRNFFEFTSNQPEWLDDKSVLQAIRINSIAKEYDMALQLLAHRFLLTIPAQFKMVIGAANQEQLTNTLGAIKAGELPATVYNEILQTLN